MTAPLTVPENKVLFLETYRTLTLNLVKLAQSDEEEVDVDRLIELLTQREAYIQSFSPQWSGDLHEPQAMQLVADIQKMDKLITARLQALRHQVQQKMNGVQQQKRGIHAYSNEYAMGAAFIDRKE